MSEINVTPFVDVMLVLLIIFMVTAPMMVQGIDVSLPETNAGPMPTDDKPLVVSIDAKGQVFIDSHAVEFDFLKQKLGDLLLDKTDKTVYLKADKNVPYGNVVKVMGEIKRAGIVKLGMVTMPDDEPDDA